ncbi:Hypothetical protein CINCED_3A006171 [Cinara cedri]|uniref:Uncharacterized protein n=1 Tax=Cinara cedri TaxID=506608 RepID=A0A5E4M8S2_9HEMI|nr:Hypothetical protein CINCED_3A006171 [Cinara cedri]
MRIKIKYNRRTILLRVPAQPLVLVPQPTALVRLQMLRAWTLHGVEEPSTPISLTAENQWCGEYFENSTLRDSLGRFCVALLFRDFFSYSVDHQASSSYGLGVSRSMALKLHVHILALGHMVPAPEPGKYFIPHHAVLKAISNELDAQDGHRFPLASSVLIQTAYVDDVVIGADIEEQLFPRKHAFICLLRSGAYGLNKWTSNSAHVVESLLSEDRIAFVSFDLWDENSVKILGLHWDTSNDNFAYHISIQQTRCIKRQVFQSLCTCLIPSARFVRCYCGQSASCSRCLQQAQVERSNVQRIIVHVTSIPIGAASRIQFKYPWLYSSYM